MSADNWSQCPNCLRIAWAETKAKLEAAATSYGKVAPEEYDRLRREAQSLNPDVDLDATLREDFQIGTSTSGEFSVFYKCSCLACGLTHSFKHVEQVRLGQ